MNQVEQWFSILRRKRLAAPNFIDIAALESKVYQFITEWNTIAHPFRWTPKSFEKILAKVDVALTPTSVEKTLVNVNDVPPIAA